MNAIVETRPKDFRDQWESMGGEVQAALPPHIPVERFMRVVLTAVNGNPDLISADRRSLFESSMKAAQDGLLPDGRDGALVVFNTKVKVDGQEKWIKKVQWMPMIGGILKKVRNSGDILSISSHVAYENDQFTYVLGDEEKIEHQPALGERGKARLVYAIAKTKDGGIYREIMTVDDVEKVRSVSKAKDSGPWKDWWAEMARKTVLRRLAKRLPMSSDLDDLVRRDDDLYEFGDKEPRITASGLKDRLLASPQPAPGFSAEHIDRETGEITQRSAPKHAQPTEEQQKPAVVSDKDSAASPAEEAATSHSSPGEDVAATSPELVLAQDGSIIKDRDGLLAKGMTKVARGLKSLTLWYGGLTAAECALIDTVYGEMKRQAAHNEPDLHESVPEAVGNKPDLNDAPRIDWWSAGKEAHQQGRGKRAMPPEIVGTPDEAEWLSGWQSDKDNADEKAAMQEVGQ
jgi:recombination protein RecT